jgi:hypothetical protein
MTTSARASSAVRFIWSLSLRGGGGVRIIVLSGISSESQALKRLGAKYSAMSRK